MWQNADAMQKSEHGQFIIENDDFQNELQKRIGMETYFLAWMSWNYVWKWNEKKKTF